MEVKSTTKFVRLSPKKARDVAREIQGLPVSSALDILTFTPKKAAFLIGKTLRSAIANAENNHELDASEFLRLKARAESLYLARRRRFQARPSTASPARAA